MKDRLKMVRESLKDESGKKMSQTKFAEAMNVTRDIIAAYELGRVEPTPLFINSLCKEYGINETWLRTGEGEMHSPQTKAQEIAAITTSLIREPNSFRSNLISVIAQLSDEQLEALEAIIDEMAKIKGEN